MFWYEDDVKKLEVLKAGHTATPTLVFYGSSSIRLWKNLAVDFEAYTPLNLGFGGSTLASCVWFFKRIMHDVQPKAMIIYAGDNDLGDGKHPEEVYIFFKQLVADIRKCFGNIPLLYISIKPSIKRFNIMEQIKFTNKIIKAEIESMNESNVFYVDIFEQMLDQNRYPRRDLFEAEGLHINEMGYALWKDAIMQCVAQNNIHLS